ncbi:MAG: RagB/SusD family nutrient uptake outer membrane protein [Daejeonella sp.]
MKNQIKSLSKYTLAAFLFLSTACNKEYLDPTRATDNVVLTSAKGLTGVAVGLQRVYTAGRTGVVYNSITASGFVSNELVLLNPGNIPELQLSSGGANIDGTNSVLNQLWTQNLKIIYDADQVIANAANLNDKSYASGLIAYASIFKALALGTLANHWENIPNEVGTNATFIPRIEGYTKAVAVLSAAQTAIAANAMSPAFLSSIPAGINIPNTLNALKARYALFAGDYTLALSSANAVDLSVKSVFNFDAVVLNPIFEIATSTNNVFQPLNADLGLTDPLKPDPNDKRIPFYTTENTTILPLIRINGFGAEGSTPIPVYLPGEMILIKAEAYARQPDLVNALIELNKVVTKSPAQDPFGVGADLPPLVGPFTQQELLDQIYKQRSIELFMSGLRLEDMRRFNRPAADRKRSFFPYPFNERDNNTNTPADPAF